ncbi:hypothetical protein V9K67_21840 [Paraflavisolibacter sp. H34]|uniref:hypothetical protein n=1 Tax=Huijunlia imazamoxiresistens TaxID=3127457 RepID=UPI003017C1BA
MEEEPLNKDWLWDLCIETLLKIYPESTIRLIRAAVENGQTPEQVQQQFQWAVDKLGRKDSALPLHAGLLAEHFQDELKEKSARNRYVGVDGKRSIEIQARRIRGRKF